MSERVTGYGLLGIGIIIMLFAVVQMFLVFTNRTKPFSIFNTLAKTESSVNIGDIVGQFQKGNSSDSGQSPSIPIPNLFPPEILNQALNLSTHFFLMSFLVGLGYKLASLGTSLLRPIKVNLKS